ncbi:M23 family metallopeptidase [Myxococcus sp. RHSTA-1-4]|uniref:M23 family metallopeptidase n=1 Tax=Myxococcus sp. RHSTA-1-4 TaxID=2874601 RepID=UPI001CBAFC26|nr:M23 family metallopeptidase [Myxococcus sp. RHSTA-1-4]MBZ4417643.1 M23 family metallopeptidase [Myxococcus sp. RHSTA-1-4]
MKVSHAGHSHSTKTSGTRTESHEGKGPKTNGTGKGPKSEGKSPKLVSPLDKPLPKRSGYNIPDGREGVPNGKGGYVHGGLDWFARPGTKVRAPQDGKVIQVTHSKKSTGQVFGGTVKVQGKDGKVWVFRHVDPAKVKVGDKVKAGDTVARVADWKGSNADHVHVELWKSANGGYNTRNLIDPLKALQGAQRDVTHEPAKSSTSSRSTTRSTDFSADLFETRDTVAIGRPISLDGYGRSYSQEILQPYL